MTKPKFRTHATPQSRFTRQPPQFLSGAAFGLQPSLQYLFQLIKIINKGAAAFFGQCDFCIWFFANE